MPKKFFVILLTPILFIAIVHLLFGIKNIESNHECIDPEKLELKGKLIFLLSEKSLTERVQRRIPCAQNVKVKKIYPSKISIELKSPIPVAQIASTSNQIMDDGTIIYGQDSKLPQLYLKEEIRIPAGEKILDPVVIFTVSIVKEITKTDFHPIIVRIISDQEVIAYDSVQKIAVFTPQKDVNLQVDSLQQTLAAAKIDGDKITKIDLRFEKPVVTFK